MVSQDPLKWEKKARKGERTAEKMDSQMKKMISLYNTPIPNAKVTAKVPELARYFPENPRTSKIIVCSDVQFKIFETI